MYRVAESLSVHHLHPGAPRPPTGPPPSRLTGAAADAPRPAGADPESGRPGDSGGARWADENVKAVWWDLCGTLLDHKVTPDWALMVDLMKWHAASPPLPLEDWPPPRG